MKKLYSIVLVLAMLFTSLTGLSGCSKGESKYLSRAEWIEMLGVQFGMDEYVSKTAHFKDVKEDSEYYKYVQSCADWGVISNAESKSFKPNSMARVDFAVETALSAINYDAEFQPALEYAREQGLITDSGYMSERGKLTREAAAKILEWTTSLYLSAPVETYENIVLNDELIDFTEAGETIQEVAEDAYVFSESKGDDVKVGDIVILPGTVLDPGGVAKKIVSIETNPDGSYSVITEQPAIEELFDEFEMSTVAVPKAEDVILEEGVTMRSNVEQMIGNGEVPKASYLKTNSTEPGIIQLGDVKGLDLSFDIYFEDGKTVGVKQNWSSLFGMGENVSFGGELSKTERKGTSAEDRKWLEDNSIFPNENLSGEEKYGNTSAIEDYKKGNSTIDELKKKLDETKEQKEEVATKKELFEKGYKVTGSLAVKNLYVQPEVKLKKFLGIPTGIKYFSVEVNYDIEAGLKVEGSLKKELPVCKIPVQVGPATIMIEIVIFGELNGEVGVKAVVSNNTKLEYDNGMTKHTAKKSASLTGNVSAQLDIGPAVKAEIKLLGASIVDAELTCAVRFKASAGVTRGTTYQETDEQIEIVRKTTFNYGVEGYVPIITAKIGYKKESLAHILGIKFSWEVVGEENAYNFHILPTKEIVIWEETQTIKKIDEEEEAIDEMAFNEYLMISTYYVSAAEGETRVIEITNLPSGYEMSDIKWSTSDSSVASVSNGTIVAKGTGSAVITVETTDGVYVAQCAITVEDDSITFTPLEGIDA